MATSESDDFESADEELDNRGPVARRTVSRRSPIVVDSETDDDNECTSVVQTTFRNTRNANDNKQSDSTAGSTAPVAAEETAAEDANPESKPTNQEKSRIESEVPESSKADVFESAKASGVEIVKKSGDVVSGDEVKNVAGESKAVSETTSGNECESEACRPRKERPQRQQKTKEPRKLGAKKLGSKIGSEPRAKPPPIDHTTPEEIREKAIAEGRKPPLIEECWEGLDDIPQKLETESSSAQSPSLKESTNPPAWNPAWDDPVKPRNVDDCWEDLNDAEMPEELKSNKKFKEVFKFDGWEGMEDEVDIPEEMTEEKIQPVLDKLSTLGEEQGGKSGGWGWGGWGVSSLINTATAGVSTITSHVSQGLTMLEETIGAPDPEDLARDQKEEDCKSFDSERKLPESQEIESQSSFGFGNLMSGVSSITKLVESTSNKVISGGLDTLETIGKKTMEVLQEGDPGLKKKRAFFMNEGEKSILSQMLREAKEKADTEEKTLEERQLARKVHFESLFDDYEGLVHLEALEMLSKQCNIKMQQRMISLDSDELTSLQETLDEVKELCDLGDEEEEEESDKDLKERLKDACKDLGVNITYDKLLDHWEETRSYLSTDPLPSDREVFQKAISTLAQFTAFSVERFHKTAELLLIKERRSTVNEADALVQLTQILSGQIGIVANSFSDKLNGMTKTSETPEVINTSITTIFLEAANASSYVQDAFKLLIPVLQVGAI